MRFVSVVTFASFAQVRWKRIGPLIGAILLAVAAPAQARNLVTICTDGTFTWVYTFDLTNSTVEMDGAFHWRGRADIDEDKITWSRLGDLNILDRHSGTLWVRSPEHPTTWNCRVSTKRTIE
jgi:hypothetical protein